MKRMLAFIFVLVPILLGAQQIVVTDTYAAGYMLGTSDVHLAVLNQFRGGVQAGCILELRIRNQSGSKTSQLTKEEAASLLQAIAEMDTVSTQVMGGYRSASIEVGSVSRGAVWLSISWDAKHKKMWGLTIGVGRSEASALFYSPDAMAAPLEAALQLLEKVEKLKTLSEELP